MSGTIQINCLGAYGRFGNQLFQYACARAYARKVGAKLETPPWIGQMLFEGVDDPPPSRGLVPLGHDVVPQNGETDVNFHGYFQCRDAYALYTLRDLRSWFQFRPWVIDEMKDYGSVPLACHLRRGDYVLIHNTFCCIAECAYVKAISDFGYAHLPVTWVNEDKPSIFRRQGLEWLIDFVTLMRAEVLFRANSTFSFWAGVLGDHKAVYSPVVDGLHDHHDKVPFVAGNHPRPLDTPSCHDHIIAP
jgi:hypothetical protein